MGCCNEPVTSLAGLPADPTQHVNYERGMVLGVDDFRQEFSYHSARGQWLARETIGYGTLSGLRVLFENDGVDGPRLHVSAGTALTPAGKLVCVPGDQCAIINHWLARPDNAVLVNRLLNPQSPPLSPPLSPSLPPAVGSGVISLYLVVCQAECLTRPVPIPGEPCRAEDELMKPSRVADDFRLELRDTAPAQIEEDALRDFALWLRGNMAPAPASPPAASDETAWLAVLRDAVQPWLAGQSQSPPSSLGDYLSELSPPALSLAPGQMHDFLRLALRYWVTELRPLWMALRCHTPQYRDVDCVLLGRIDFEVGWIGGAPTGAWQVTGAPPLLRIDESTRPILAHQRLLQELACFGCQEDAAIGALATERGYALPEAPLPFLDDAAPRAIPPFMRDGGALRLPVLSTDTDLSLDDTHHIVIAHGAATLAITLPASTPMTQGRVYTIRNTDVEALKIRGDVNGPDRIDGNASLALKKKRAVTLVADGAGQWHSIATT